MADKPIFVATHPRACSTAFERVFMTRRDVLKCIHEPFGDAFYYGPERLAERFANDSQVRQESGFSQSTYKTILARINKENTEGKRLFIKDMIQYLVPPKGKPASLAPSLLESPIRGHSQPLNDHSRLKKNHAGRSIRTEARVSECKEAPLEAPYDTISEIKNPTVVPSELLKQFQFAFLIRHPRKSIPSYYRCCIPPLSDLTGFQGFNPDEAGYNELRRTFDYLRGDSCFNQEPRQQKGEGKIYLADVNGLEMAKPSTNICVMDADDLLSAPEEVLSIFCEYINIDFHPKMLHWDNSEDQKIAIAAFEKWKGFHEDAIDSKNLRPRPKKEDERTDEDYFNDWVQKYGHKAACIIQKAVDENIADYEYLKRYAIRI